MDFQSLFLAGLSVVCGILGWFAREMYAAVTKLKDDLNRLEVRLGTDYVRYDRLQDAMRPILQALERVENALAGKADKK